jgi:hypothetical protein
MMKKAIQKLTELLEGRIPEKMETGGADDSEESARELAVRINQLIDFMREMHNYILPLSRGELDAAKMQSNNYLASPFKELHSRLVHLTWQTKQVSRGDYSQRVDFMGDFSEAFNAMIIALDINEKLLKKKIDELETALAHIIKLESILPICSNCKKIRLEGADPKKQDSWMQMESYLSSTTNILFSHGICPACKKKIYPDLRDGSDE